MSVDCLLVIEDFLTEMNEFRAIVHTRLWKEIGSFMRLFVNCD